MTWPQPETGSIAKSSWCRERGGVFRRNVAPSLPPAKAPGWWLSQLSHPSENMKVSWDDDSQLNGNKKHVPNHQSDSVSDILQTITHLTQDDAIQLPKLSFSACATIEPCQYTADLTTTSMCMNTLCLRIATYQIYLQLLTIIFITCLT